MTRPPSWVLAAFAALCLWHAALKRHGLSLPLIIDEGEYAYEAKIWAAGGLPYRDAVSPKPPMIFLAYRLCYALGGGPSAPRVLFILLSFAAMALLFAATPEKWGWGARLAPAAAFAALSAYPAGSLGFAANTEFLTAFFTTAAALALLRSWRERAWSALSGAACGAALMSKPTCLWTIAALGFLAAWGADRKRAERLLLFCLAAAALPLVFLAYFAARGGVAEFWNCVFSRNMDYARAALETGAWRDQLDWAARTVAPLLIKGSWPVLGLAVAGLYGVSSDRRHGFEILVVAWLGTSVAGLAAGFLFFPHYFLQALPPLCLAAGLGVERLSRKSARRGFALLAAISVAPALSFGRVLFIDPPRAVAKELLFPNPLFESLTVADYIREHSIPSETMYVFGSEPQLYVYAERAAATPHITVLPLTMYPREGEGERELARLRAAPPRFVVCATQPGSTLVASKLGADFRDAFRAWLGVSYRFAGSATADSESSLLVFERR